VIVTTGTLISGVTTRAYSDSGNQLWTADYGGNSHCVAFFDDGGVIIGGDIGIKKYTSEGAFVFQITDIGVIYGVAVDSQGNFYTAGTVFNSYTLRKYDSSGNFIWGINHNRELRAVTVDSSDNVYFGGVLYSGYTTKKYSSAGSFLWGVNDTYDIYGIAVRGTAVVTVGQYFSFGQTIRAYNTSGVYQWGIGYGATVYGVAIDSNGNVFTAGNGVNSYAIAVRTFSPTGTLLAWSSTLSNYIMRAIALDSDNNLFVCGDLRSSQTTHKYNSASVLQYQRNHGASCRGIAWINPSIKSYPPGLSMPVQHGLPDTDFFSLLPSLSIPYSLAITDSSLPNLPPEFAHVALSKIYLALLSSPGMDDLLTVPMSSFQCVRRLGASTWVTVTIPFFTPSWLISLTNRLGGELLINAGIKDSSGIETLGLFLRATLTAVEYTIEPVGAAITLTARVINPSYSSASRELTGIRQRTKTDGRWTLVCDADPLLRPNDTATAGAISFIVGSIRHSVSANDAVIEVIENG